MEESFERTRVGFTGNIETENGYEFVLEKNRI